MQLEAKSKEELKQKAQEEWAVAREQQVSTSG